MSKFLKKNLPVLHATLVALLVVSAATAVPLFIVMYAVA